MLRELIRSRRRAQSGSDDGVALVAAISVAMVGVALSTLVVTQAIVVTNDAARDRVRTAEIHSAEGALDAALREMETGLTCLEPSFSPILIGEGTSAIEVTVTIEYFDENDAALLACSGGYVSGDAVRARVTSTGVPVNPVPGVDPERSIMAEVRITPNQGLSVGASIFASSTLETVNSGEVEASDPNYPASVWIDSGNYDCKSSFIIDGDLIVVDGGISMRNSCKVTGDAWAKSYFDVATSVNGWRIAGDTTVAAGNFTQANNSAYGGNLSVFGTISGSPTVAGSICSANVGSPCPSFDLYEARGFPEVNYVPSDWAPDLVEKSISTFTTDMIDAGGFKSASAESSFAANPCQVQKQWLDGPFHLNATESSGSLYDLRSCNMVMEGVTLKIYEDTAFFVNGFREQNGFRVESGDGEPHDVWIIVPWGGTGDILLSNQSQILAPISIFMYTPNRVQIDNQQTINGQIYGQNIHVSNNFKLSYVPMGIPGVDLGGGLTVVESGYSIEIEKKRELRN
jgi:hypothetical protein